METISLAIVSSDLDYGKALSVGLMDVYKDFVIRVVDSRQFITEWSAFKGREPYYRKYDIVLWADKEGINIFGDNIVWLTDKMSETVKNYREKKFALYKYSPAHVTVSAIFDIYMSLTGRRAVNIHKDFVGIYGFSSWEGGSGCTSLALAFAQEMCRFRGKKVMYMSFEPIESTGMFFNEGSGCKSTAEYLYRLLKERKNGIISTDGDSEIPFLDSYIVRDTYGVEAFAPSRGMNPLCGLNERDTQLLIASIADSGRYDVIVIDLGTCVAEAAMAAGKLADRIVNVTGTGEVTVREEQYKSHLMVMTGDIGEKKSLRVINGSKPECEEISEGIYVSKNLNLIQGKIKEITLDGEFGDDIRKLTDLITKPYNVVV